MRRTDPTVSSDGFQLGGVVVKDLKEMSVLHVIFALFAASVSAFTGLEQIEGSKCFGIVASNGPCPDVSDRKCYMLNIKTVLTAVKTGWDVDPEACAKFTSEFNNTGKIV